MRILLHTSAFILLTFASFAGPAFVNPIYEGADPWIVKHNDTYYACQSKGDVGVLIWKSDRLTDKGTRRTVWEPPKESWNSQQVWAPELHHLRGKWYIYYAASDGDNKNHRMGVLESETDDPQGSYIDRGMLYTGDDFAAGTENRWAIDGTPLEIGDQLYHIWSGWEGEEDVQYLYIAPMENPYTISGNRVRMAGNDDYTWERVNNDPQERGLAEGPQVLKHEGRVYVIYSTSASWLPSYKLALLELVDQAKPLEASSWKKHDRAVFQGTEQVLGTGHASFVQSPDGTEDWIVYHSKRSPKPGWLRAVSIQKFNWTVDGFPYFGEPVPAGVILDAPSGEKTAAIGDAFSDTIENNNWDNWVYYGYGLFIFTRDGALNIGGRPNAQVVNDYRSGEKALVRGEQWQDSTITASVQVRGDGNAGLLCRVTLPHIGEAAFYGYYAGIDATNDRVVLMKSNGVELSEIAAASKELEPHTSYQLSLRAEGNRFNILLNGERLIDATDGDYSSGMTGIRVSETHGVFDDFSITSLTNP